jgi:ribulose 1,5-bisphosphate synthetase/thiazole synthase
VIPVPALPVIASLHATKYTRRVFFVSAAALTVAGSTIDHAAAQRTTAASAVAPSQPRVTAVDVLVCSGGPSGMAAAVIAARSGAKVLWVERYGQLGGMCRHGSFP